MSNKIELVFNIDPLFFEGSEDKTESFAFNLNKNIEQMFNIKSDYKLVKNGNSYRILESDKKLDVEISFFIEDNWFSKQ
jgi:hypothetical protein